MTDPPTRTRPGGAALVCAISLLTATDLELLATTAVYGSATQRTLVALAVRLRRAVDAAVVEGET